MEARESGGAVALGPDDDVRTVVASHDTVLAAFDAEWCSACRRMRPVLDAIAADTDAAVRTVDVESHLESAIEFGAQSAPTVVLFVEGRPVKTLRGERTEDELRGLVERYGA